MTTDNDNTTATLFRTPGGGGTFFRPSPGQYIGTFVEHRVGNPSTRYPEKDGSPSPRTRWVWSATTIDGQPVLDDEGKPTEIDGQTSLNTGPDSNAYKYFAAHGHKLIAGEDMAAASESIVGKKVRLLYTDSGRPEDQTESGRRTGHLTVVMPYDE